MLANPENKIGTIVLDPSRNIDSMLYLFFETNLFDRV